MIIYAIIHLVSAVITYGMLFARWHKAYPAIAKESYRENMSTAMLVGLLFGPIGTFTCFFLTGFCEYGFKWK